jgi:hypothetical protein
MPMGIYLYILPCFIQHVVLSLKHFLAHRGTRHMCVSAQSLLLLTRLRKLHMEMPSSLLPA